MDSKLASISKLLATGLAIAPTMATTIAFAAPSAPAARPSLFVAIEFGIGKPDDDKNIYGNGLGKTLVIGIKGFEARLLEYYDLEDRTGMYDDVRGAQGQLGISSLGYRWNVINAGPFEIGCLIGAAWLRRPSLWFDPMDELGGSAFERHSQHGIGALLGGGLGIRIGPLNVGFDARIYPTSWSELTGMRVTVPGQIEAITESPGGIPITLGIWAGAAIF